MNLIRFLSGRIDFLNEKVAMLCGASAERKLSCYLYQQYQAQNSLDLLFKPKITAERINVGRASLYRALSSLAEQEIIQISDKKIIIKKLDELERMSK